MRVSWDRTKGRPEPIALLNKVVEKENGEPLVDMTVNCPSVRFIRPQAIKWCREQVADRLEAAAKSLPQGYFLSLVEAWRPIERQQRIFDFWLESATEAFPTRSSNALRRTACRWAAPTDQKAPPGHCTGAAVDVWLVNEAGDQYDVISPYVRVQAARTYTLGLSDEAYRNRMILVEAMLAQGFSNCRDEWWHYSFGDAGWAVRMGLSECVYGLARLDEDLYAENERQWIEMFKARSNPFLPEPSLDK